MKRDKNDIQWQELKEVVRSRDHNQDRLLRVLTMKEALLLKKNASRSQLEKLDVAHIYPVSVYPELTYVKNNVVVLNRYSHENLDSSKDPITGQAISYEEVMRWWERIAGTSQWEKLSHHREHLKLELLPTRVETS